VAFNAGGRDARGPSEERARFVQTCKLTLRKGSSSGCRRDATDCKIPGVSIPLFPRQKVLSFDFSFTPF
jgi:hypothetical protein